MQEMQVRDIHHMISLICEILKKKIRLVKYREQIRSCKRWGRSG